MRDFFNALRPYNVFHPKVRLGPPEDGGYVVNEIMLDKSTCLMTYGVGGDMRYEIDYCGRYQKNAYLFDHTIAPGAWKEGRLIFTPEGLGFGPRCKDVFEHYSDLNLSGDILLKIDIEGGEYDYFFKTDVAGLSTFTTGILLEIHTTSAPKCRDAFVGIMERLLQYYMVTHIHGNNHDLCWEFQGYPIPNAFELTLINRKYVTTYKLDTETYPQYKLDVPNKWNTPDYNLTFIENLTDRE